jgi:hypothetical protein
MKTKITLKLTIFAFLFAFSTLLKAQIPQAINFQAIARDASGNIMANTPIQIQLSVIDGSATGTVIYKELRALTTNAYGSFSFQIGVNPYSVLVGKMTDINWINGSKFLKIDYDPTNQLHFDLTLGTIQFVTVPYAFAAGSVYKIDASNASSGDILKYNTTSGNFEPSVNKPDWANITNKPAFFDGTWTSLTEKPSLFDGTWSSLSGKPAFATVATSGSYSDLTNKPAIDGSETKVSAGSNITVTGSGTSGSPYVIGNTNHYIGESYGGGTVFYVYDNGLHGLIAATADQSTGIRWYNGTYTTTNAARDGIGAGMYNTERIIESQGEGSYAAQLCANYQGGGYGDWYLPSKYELNLLYAQKNAVGVFASGFYWSSYEDFNTGAWVQSFGTGSQISSSKNTTYYVRSVRAF